MTEVSVETCFVNLRVLSFSLKLSLLQLQISKREKKAKYATSYFAGIALAKYKIVIIAKEDYWIFINCFSMQGKIIEYLIMNFTKRVFCHLLPFGKNEKAIKQKRR